jgi:hypothetical protein
MTFAIVPLDEMKVFVGLQISPWTYPRARASSCSVL